MQLYLDSVDAFMRKFQLGTPTPDLTETHRDLTDVAIALSDISDRLEESDEQCGIRMHHMTEELAELCTALCDGDEVEALDAITDLLYTVLGTALVFDLPIIEAFSEVHRSNMLKDFEQDRPGHPIKGEAFIEPQLEVVLTKWRDGIRSISFTDSTLAKMGESLDVRGLPPNEVEALRKQVAKRVRELKANNEAL